MIENWPVLCRNTICFPSPQLAIKLDGLRSRAGMSHPKLKACIPRWSEVKSFDPALRTEEPSSVSAPQSQTSTHQGNRGHCGRVQYTLGASPVWGEERHHGGAGGWVGVNMSSEMKHVFTPEYGSWLGLTVLMWSLPWGNSDFVERRKLKLCDPEHLLNTTGLIDDGGYDGDYLKDDVKIKWYNTCLRGICLVHNSHQMNFRFFFLKKFIGM